MPIYEFECCRCKIIIEKQCSMDEPNKPSCPECNGRTKKIMSQTSFSLKGDCWHRDGYTRTGLPSKKD